eukprot:215062_1
MSFEKSLHLVYITLHIITKMHGEIITPSSTSKYETHSCVGNESCTINCGSYDYTGYCQQDTIHCPSAPYPCTVNCNGKSACYYSNIIWDNTPGLGTLTCIGEYACWEVTFPSLHPTTAVNITCQGLTICAGATIYCPSDADCAVYCEGPGSCAVATIYGPVNGNLWVQCTDRDSCNSATIFNCPSEPGHCSVKCDSDNCQNARFIYPTEPPTKYPSSSPTVATTEPSSMPSKQPSKRPIDEGEALESTLIATDTTKNPGAAGEKDGSDVELSPVVWVLIGLGAGVAICGIIVAFIFYCKKKKAIRQVEPQSHNIRQNARLDAVNQTHGNDKSQNRDIVDQIRYIRPYDEDRQDGDDMDMGYTNEGSVKNDSDSLENIYVKDKEGAKAMAPPSKSSKQVQKKEEQVTKGDAYYDEYLQGIHDKKCEDVAKNKVVEEEEGVKYGDPAMTRSDVE